MLPYFGPLLKIMNISILNRKHNNNEKSRPSLLFLDFKIPQKWFIPLSGPPFRFLLPIASGLVPLFLFISKYAWKTLKIWENCLWQTSNNIYFTSWTLLGLGFIAIGASQGSFVFRLNNENTHNYIKTSLSCGLKILCNINWNAVRSS